MQGNLLCYWFKVSKKHFYLNKKQIAENSRFVKQKAQIAV